MRSRDRMTQRPPCQCIECGCDDNHACPDLLGDPCSWLVRSEVGRLGVCSQCPTALRRWNANQRHFSDKATQAIAARRLMDRAARAISHKPKKTQRV